MSTLWKIETNYGSHIVWATEEAVKARHDDYVSCWIAQKRNLCDCMFVWSPVHIKTLGNIRLPGRLNYSLTNC